MSNTTLRSLALSGLSAMVLAGSLLGAALPAQAAQTTRDGTCAPGEFCYYSNATGATTVSDFKYSVAALGRNAPNCQTFLSRGPGHGECVRNNAEMVWNRTSTDVTVFYSTNYRGASQTIRSGQKVRLNASLINNNASHRVGSARSPRLGESAVGGRISRDEVLARADDWLNHDPKLEYNMGGYAADLRGRSYRRDCSGFVSMALHANASYGTANLTRVVHRIPWSDLRPGDIVGTLGARSEGANGHVVLFAKWLNADRTRFQAIEFNGTAADMTVMNRPIGQKKGALPYLPYRYDNVSD